jgi:LysR family transcriptional regulator, salicylic acid-responsive activator of bsdBCD
VTKASVPTVRAVVERSLASGCGRIAGRQPNLSTALKQLEAEWGVSLFERTVRGPAATDTGRALYERAAELLGGVSALDS